MQNKLTENEIVLFTSW